VKKLSLKFLQTNDQIYNDSENYEIENRLRNHKQKISNNDNEEYDNDNNNE